MDNFKHHVLDDVTAEKTRNSVLFKVRSKESLPTIVAFLSLLLTVPLWVTSDGNNGYALLLGSLITGAIGYWVGCCLYVDNDLEPLSSSFSFGQLKKLADEHPSVAEFVTDAIEKGRTFRTRDMRAARRIEQMASSQALSDYEVRESADAAIALDELIKSYSPSEPSKSNGTSPGKRSE